MVDLESFTRPVVKQSRQTPKFGLQDLIRNDGYLFANAQKDDLTFLTLSGEQRIHISPLTDSHDSVLRVSQSNVDITGTGGATLQTACNIDFYGLNIINAHDDLSATTCFRMHTGTHPVDEHSGFTMILNNTLDMLDMPYNHTMTLQNHQGPMMLMPKGDRISIYTQSDTGFVGVQNTEPEGLVHVSAPDDDHVYKRGIMILEKKRPRHVRRTKHPRQYS